MYARTFNNDYSEIQNPQHTIDVYAALDQRGVGVKIEF